MRPPAAAVASGRDGRMPAAWSHREQNFHQNPQRPWSPASTTTATEDTSSEVETSVSGRVDVPPIYDRTHTIRSTHSVPALNAASTWDGEPCPVHGGHLLMYCAPPRHLHLPHHPASVPFPAGQTMRRAGSMFDMRVTPYYPAAAAVYSGHPMPAYLQPPLPGHTLEKNSHYGSLHSLHSGHQSVALAGAPLSVTPVPPPYNLPPMPPSHLLPPGMRPRPLVIPATVEPLPVRDPTKSKLPANNILGPGGGLLPGKALLQDGERLKQRYHCCRGPLPLVWFIISIVTCGVVLGVVLGSIYG